MNLVRKLAFAVALASPGVASAEAVMVRHGDSTGNGWLFVDRDGFCRLATPAHVVQSSSGDLVDVLILDRAGRTMEGGRAVVPAAGVDLAFLDVKPFGETSLCTRSRLGEANLAAAIDAMREADLEIMGEGDLQRETVERIAQARADIANTITVRPINPGFRLLEGYSGSIVLAEGRPLAMVTNVFGDANVGIALRFDEIARYVAASPPPPAASDETAIVSVIALTGETVDPSRPPSAATGETGWKVGPANGRVAIEIVTDGKPIAGLAFTIEGLAAGKAIIEHRAATGSTFAYVAPCYIGEGVARCSFSGRTLEVMRVTIPAAAPVTIYGLQLLR